MSRKGREHLRVILIKFFILLRGNNYAKVGENTSFNIIIFTVIFGSFLVYYYTFLLQIRDIIAFSVVITILSLGTPFTLYAFMGMTVELVLGKDSKCFKIMMKYNKLTMKYLYDLLFIGLIGGFPVSFVVNTYL